MMLPTTLVLLATSFIAALAAPLEERAVSDILSDISLVNSELTNLESDLEGLSKAGVFGLSDLDVQSNRAIASFQRATAASAATGPLSEADAGNVAQHVGASAETLVNVLNLYVENKPAFEQFAKIVPGLIPNVEETLENLATAVTGFTNDLVKNAPADIDAADGPIRTAVAGAFATAIATFQS